MIIDATFWVAIAFIIFIAGLIYLKIPQKINFLLNNMIEDIRNELNEAEKLKKEAKNLLNESQEKLENAQKENEQIIKNAREESEKLIIEINNKFFQTSENRKKIIEEKIVQMKKDAVVVNTSRGGIICESDLYSVMKSGYLGGAGIDVFETEPYMGPLGKLESCILTAHMGSMSFDCRSRMEMEATEDAIRFATGESIRQGVPEEEFEAQLIK